MTADELLAVERRVNQAILSNLPVTIGHSNLQDAKAKGATALFGEKYGDIVRTIRIGGEQTPYSLELCGGTHVGETAEIGLFHIVSEGSVGANLRRVEAVTGRGSQELVWNQLGVLSSTAAQLNVLPSEVSTRVQALLEESQSAQREILRLQRHLAKAQFARLIETDLQQVGGASVLSATIEGVSEEILREMTDWFRDRVGSGVVALGMVDGNRPLFVVGVTADLVDSGLTAVQLVRSAAKLIGGGGGGKPTLARAGGRNKEGLRDALAAIPKLVTDWTESVSRG